MLQRTASSMAWNLRALSHPIKSVWMVKSWWWILPLTTVRQSVYFLFIRIQCDRHLSCTITNYNIVNRNYKLIILLQAHSVWFMILMMIYSLQIGNWKRNIHLLNCYVTMTFWTTSLRWGAKNLVPLFFSLSFQFAIFVNFHLKILIIILAAVTINNLPNGTHEFH